VQPVGPGRPQALDAHDAAADARSVREPRAASREPRAASRAPGPATWTGRNRAATTASAPAAKAPASAAPSVRSLRAPDAAQPVAATPHAAAMKPDTGSQGSPGASSADASTAIGPDPAPPNALATCSPAARGTPSHTAQGRSRSRRAAAATVILTGWRSQSCASAGLAEGRGDGAEGDTSVEGSRHRRPATICPQPAAAPPAAGAAGQASCRPVAARPRRHRPQRRPPHGAPSPTHRARA